MPKLPNMLDMDMKGKVVLIRMDHNVVKKGKIKDSMRIDATIPTLLHIFKKGGLPVLMSHVGRPYDKKSGEFNISKDDAVEPIVAYLEEKLQLKGLVPDCGAEGKSPIVNLKAIPAAIDRLKAGEVDFVYLPNTRWFRGEEAKDESANAMAISLASFADLYVNDAFGSWQAHTSTYGLPRQMPAAAGLLLQKEIKYLQQVFEPQRPFVAVVAGSKFDTKIGPLSSLIKIADHLILGGVIYNAYLCHKYGISIKGVGADDIAQAARFCEEIGDYQSRIVELPLVIESAELDSVSSAKAIRIADLKPGDSLSYVLDAAPQAFEGKISEIFADAATVFVNAVMGLTPVFYEGTKAMYQMIDANKKAMKLFGGGDTIQDFKEFLPGVFAKAVNDPGYYFFTGGGAILDAIQQGSAFGMKPVQALLEQN
jgi:phosphoglycerate kinase